MKFITLNGQAGLVVGNHIFLNDFEEFLTALKNSSTTVCYQGKTGNGRSCWFFPEKGFLIATYSNGFETIQDAIDSRELDFKNPNEYSRFRQSQAQNREEFQQLVNDGFSTIEEKLRYNENNVDRFFNQLLNLESNKQISKENQIILNGVKRPGDALRCWLQMKEPPIAELIEFFQSNFSSLIEWQKAREGNFDNEADYTNAVKAGFKNSESFQNANKLGIRNNGQYQKYCDDIGLSKEGGFSCVEVFLLSKMGRMPNRLKMIYGEMVRGAKSKYGENYSYSESFKSIEKYASLGEILAHEPVMKELNRSAVEGIGSSNENLECVKVVVDASNVCWFENNNRNSKGKLRAQELRDFECLLLQYGVKEAHFVADANLKYEVEDVSVLNEMEENGLLSYSHGEQADRKLLSFAKNRGFVLVSNDQYRDWKEFDMSKIVRIGFIKDTKLGFDLN